LAVRFEENHSILFERRVVAVYPHGGISSVLVVMKSTSSRTYSVTCKLRPQHPYSYCLYYEVIMKFLYFSYRRRCSSQEVDFCSSVIDHVINIGVSKTRRISSLSSTKMILYFYFIFCSLLNGEEFLYYASGYNMSKLIRRVCLVGMFIKFIIQLSVAKF